MDVNPYESPRNLDESGQTRRMSLRDALLAALAWFAVAYILYSVINIPIVNLGKWILTAAAFTAWVGVGIGALTMRRRFIWIGATVGATVGGMFALLAVQ
jgi:hypothetical protein